MGSKVHLGCGLHAVEGWVNIDRSPGIVLDRLPPIKIALRRIGVLSEAHMATWPRSVIRRDVRKRLPFEDSSVAAIYSSHMLEHLPLTVAEGVLAECKRVLSEGGVIRLALPDGLAIARELVDARGSALAARSYSEALCATDSRSGWRRLISSATHQWQPTSPLVIQLLFDAGFQDPIERAYHVGHLPDLEVIERRPESLFVEATG